MSFNLGLEALADNGKVEVTTDVLSYEFLDTVMQFNAEASEAVVIADGIGSLCSAYENLGAICDVLAEHGNSPALEALVGGNFREGFSIEAASNAKEGLWARFVKWLKTLWAKIKAFFAKFFTSSKAMRTKLRERVQEIKSNGNKIVELTIKVPELSIMERNNEEIKKLLLAKIEKANESLADGEKISTDDLESFNAKDDDPLARMVGVAAGQEVNIDGEKACAILERLDKRLEILESAKAKIDKVADDLEKKSFAITNTKPYATNFKEGDTAEYSKGKEKTLTKDEAKATNEAGKKANAELKDKASADYRSRVMRFHSEISKYLSKATKNAIADASYALSAFKAKKKD